MAFKIKHFPGRELRANGQVFLYFGGTSYLGLQTDPAFQKCHIANIKTYGTNYGASRISNVQLGIFEEAEQHLSTLVGSEACTTLSSGFLAGQLVAKEFNALQYERFYAPNTHCALFSMGAACFNSYSDLDTALRDAVREQQNKTPVVFLDAIDFEGNNYPHFRELQRLPLNKVILVVDDSHGIGIVGKNGSGVFQQLRECHPKELLVCCSLGKGFGIQAGAIFGSTERIEQFTKTDFFGGASPAAPAALATLVQSEDIYRNKREKLLQNIELFSKGIVDISNFSWMKNHPAFSFSNPELASYLENNRIIITNFNYPAEDASAMSRIVISADHSEADIVLLTGHINTFFG